MPESVPVPTPDTAASAETLREQVAAKINDAYYDARNRGDTMDNASVDAAQRVLDLIGAEVAAERERIAQAIEALRTGWTYNPDADLIVGAANEAYETAARVVREAK